MLLHKIFLCKIKLYGKDISLWNHLYTNAFCCSAKTSATEENNRSLDVLGADFALRNIFLLLKDTVLHLQASYFCN